MESERPASAHRIEGVRSAICVSAATFPELTVVNMGKLIAGGQGGRRSGCTLSVRLTPHPDIAGACRVLISTCWSPRRYCWRNAAWPRAARRLRLSPSAMSRALARLRETVGDPLLVRAGRSSRHPRALELRERVSQLVPEVEAVLRPTEQFNLETTRAHVHAADQRGAGGKLRPGFDCAVAARRPA